LSSAQRSASNSNAWRLPDSVTARKGIYVELSETTKYLQ
jgi:hypothetical protein